MSKVGTLVDRGVGGRGGRSDRAALSRVAGMERYRLDAWHERIESGHSRLHVEGSKTDVLTQRLLEYSVYSRR